METSLNWGHFSGDFDDSAKVSYFCFLFLSSSFLHFFFVFLFFVYQSFIFVDFWTLNYTLGGFLTLTEEEEAAANPKYEALIMRPIPFGFCHDSYCCLGE